MYKVYKSDWMKHINFLITDLVCVQLVFLIPYFMDTVSADTSTDYLVLQLIMSLAEICVAFFLDMYRDIYSRGYLIEAGRVITQQSLIFGITLVYTFADKSSTIYSRLAIGIMWIASIILTYTARIIIKKVSIKYFSESKNYKSILLIAGKENIHDIITTARNNRFSDFHIIGAVIIDGTEEKEIMGIPVVCSIENINNYLVSNVVDEVFINVPGNIYFSGELINNCVDMGIAVHCNLEKLQNSITQDTIEDFAGYRVITKGIKMVSPGQLFIKRAMDIAGSVVGLLVTGLIYLVVAPIIYIKSPGPIFFSQMRVGLNGRKFKIYKFRSMYMDAEERKKELMAKNKMTGLMFKLDDDPRIIKGIGNFIRKTSIDELPQMWNVLKGQMSLVGTRPPTVDEFEKYDCRHKRRLATKPGITGMWQISGRSNITDFEEVVRLDTKYIYEWNIRLDIKILFKTILVVFGRDGSV